MNRWFKQFAVVASSVLLLTGCSLFSSDDDVIIMAELPVFEATYTPKIAWQKSISNGVDKYYSQLKPVADNFAVYVASRDGEVKSFAVNGGKLLWSADFSEHKDNDLNRSARFSGGVHLALDTLFIGTENGQVLALDKNSGELLWWVKVTGEVVAEPVYSDGKVIVHTTRGDLIALDSVTGEEIWTLSNKQPKLTLRSSATPSISQGGIVYGRSDGFVAVALLETGRPLWQIPVARPHGATELERMVDADMQPIINNGIVYALAYNGNLVAIDLLKGQQLWSRKYSGFNNMALSGNTLYLSDYRGFVFAVNSHSGDELWVNDQLSYRNVTAVAVANQYVVVGDGEGYLHWLDRDNGSFVAQQYLDSKGLYAEPFVTDSYLYLQSRSGKLFAIEKPIINKK